MSSVRAQLHREEESQKPQPPPYNIEHLLPAAFSTLWEPVRDTDTLQGKAILVLLVHTYACVGGYEKKN